MMADPFVELVDAMRRATERMTELVQQYGASAGLTDDAWEISRMEAKVQALSQAHDIIQEEFQSVLAQMRADGLLG